ncbi:hypothetical protein [Sphingobium sp.]|uniref:hypothetical protein n=1 Tax=Sphingobium sp. TaxID=1912891 RepID=UPI002627CFE6|nr:hypothetical protein [Sphingobium sp.]
MSVVDRRGLEIIAVATQHQIRNAAERTDNPAAIPQHGGMSAAENPRHKPFVKSPLEESRAWKSLSTSVPPAIPSAGYSTLSTVPTMAWHSPERTPGMSA